MLDYFNLNKFINLYSWNLYFHHSIITQCFVSYIVLLTIFKMLKYLI